MKLLLLVNSSASAVTARARVVIQKALSADHTVAVAETSRRGHATRLAQAAARDTDVVVCLGGDGTLNEAANGLAGSSCALAALPGGSTNVFARTLGLPLDPIEATGALVEALAAGSVRRVGLGSVNGRYFLFHVGLGFDAAVVAQVERRATLKRYLSHPLFVYSALTTWFRHYDRSRARFEVHHPGSEPVASAFAIVLNTNPYTYLGSRPLNVAREATLDRGLVTMTLRSISFTRVVGLAATALSGRTGAVGRLSFVEEGIDVTAFAVTGRGPFPYQVDGDHLGDAEALEFRHDPGVLDVVVPLPVGA